MNAIDLFSGAGGLTIALENSGFSVVMANEINHRFAETHNYNFPHIAIIKLFKQFLLFFSKCTTQCLVMIGAAAHQLLCFRIATATVAARANVAIKQFFKNGFHNYPPNL